MKKFLIFVLVLIVVAGCVVGGAAAYRFNDDPNTPLGKGYSLIDSLYNIQMNFSNRLFLNGLYGINLTESQTNALFEKNWLPKAGYVGNPVTIRLSNGAPADVRLVISADPTDEDKISKMLVLVETGAELPVVN